MTNKDQLTTRIQELEHQNKVLRNENGVLQQTIDELQAEFPFSMKVYHPVVLPEFQPNSFWVQPLNKYLDDFFHPLSCRDLHQRDFPWVASEGDITFGTGVATEATIEYRDTEETKQKVREMAELIDTLSAKLKDANAPLIRVIEAIKRKARFVSPAAAYELFEQMDYIFKDIEEWNNSVGELQNFLLREKNRALLPPPPSVNYPTDQQMADAISSICGEDKPLDDKQKWLGVCCMVRAKYNYPYDIEACCKRLAALPYRKPLYKVCDYGSVRKLAIYGFCREPFDNWKGYRPKDTEKKYFDSCFYVGRELELAINEISKNY